MPSQAVTSRGHLDQVFPDSMLARASSQVEMPTMDSLSAEADPPHDPIPTIPEPLPNALPILGAHWSQRHKPSYRLLESVKRGFLSFQSVFDNATGDYEYEIQSQLWDPIALAAKTSDLDTMRADQALG